MNSRHGDSTNLISGQPDILIQLYSVHEQLVTDYARTIRQLSQAGAKNAELYWFDAQPAVEEMKGIFSDNGVRPLAMHANLKTLTHSTAKVIDACHHLAVRDVIMPWMAPEIRQSPDCWTHWGSTLNALGKTLRDEGIGFGYHNHDFEFAAGADGLPMQTLLDATDASLVFWEIDTYWVRFAGHSVLDWINQYSKRIRAVHFKDYRAGHMVELGTGELPWKDIVTRLSAMPVKYWVLEQEEFAAGDPWGELARGLAFLESCKVAVKS